MHAKKYIAGALVVLGVVGIGLGIYGHRASANTDGGMMGGHDFGEQMKQAHAVGSTLEVHISDSGAVLVRGAKVTAVSGSVINASTSWNGASMSWQIMTSGATRYVEHFGNSSAAGAVAVGDLVSFSGTLASGSAGTLGVNATIVKDWSAKVPVNVKTTVEGSAKTAPAGAAPMTFILTVGGKDYTVRVAADTAVLNTLWLRGAIGNIHVGDDVRVYGMVNADMTIDATVVRDVSLR